MHNDRTKKQALSVCDGFKDLVGVNLYRRNAFRVLGIPIDATIQSAVKSQKLREMQQKLGMATTAQSEVLPLTPPPDAELLRRSNECLQDPACRLAHSFFWLWPVERDAGPAVALSSLHGSHPAVTLRAWLAFVESEPGAVTARHNVAVLAHMLALDLEARVATRAVSSDEQRARWAYWELSYRHWRRLCDDPAFWQRAKNLRDAIDDPRLPQDMAHRLQEWCPQVIIGATASLLISSAERESKAGVLRSAFVDASVCFDSVLVGQPNTTAGSPITSTSATTVELQGHIQLLKTAGWNPALLDRAIADALQPTLEQIRTLSGQLSEYTPATPRDLFSETLGAMLQAVAVVEVLLATENSQRAAAMDVVSEALLQACISHGNEDRQWSRWLVLTDLLLGLAASPLLRDRLAKTAEVLRGNIEAARSEEEFEEAAKVLRRGMATDVEVGSKGMRVPQMCTCCLEAPQLERPYTFIWDEQKILHRVRHTVTFQFPLCAECERHRRDDQSKGFWLVTISILVAAVLACLCRPIPEANGWAVAGGSTLAAMLGMFLLAGKMRYRPLDSSHACQGESVKIKRGDGDGALVTFHNPIYAQAFAQANAFRMHAPRPSSANRGVSPLGGSAGVKRALFVLACGLIVSGAAFSWGADSDDTSASTSASPSYAPPTQSWSTPSSPPAPAAPSWPAPAPGNASARPEAQLKLASEIDAGKVRLQQLESEVKSEEERLRELKTEIDVYKTEIEGYESAVRLDMYVDETAYKSTVDAHNVRVRSYNAHLGRYRRALAEYNSTLEELNAKVALYNSRLTR